MEEITKTCNGTCEVCTCKSKIDLSFRACREIYCKAGLILNDVQAALVTNYYSLITQS